MATSRIKGITVEINGDTTGLSKALSSVNKEMKSTQSQLKDMEKLLKLDPTNTELLTQKQKLLTEAVSETKEKLEEAARSAGETTKFSATKAAEAMSYMGLAGWSADEMCDGLSGVLNLAAASEMDLASASDIVTDYLSAFGLTAADSETLVDKMAYAMSNSNTSTSQLGEAYKNCAATATQLGYGLDETTAALMVMADAGIKGGEAGTALSSIMTRLGNNTSGCTDMLAKYGIEVYDTEGNVNSLSNILSGMQGIKENAMTALDQAEYASIK